MEMLLAILGTSFGSYLKPLKRAFDEDLKMNKDSDKWDKKIKLSLPAWYVFDCCMERVMQYVDDDETGKLENWENFLEFLIDTDFFWECNVNFDEVIDGFIKNNEVRFICVDELSEKGLEYYKKINKVKVDDVDLIDKNDGYDLDDDNYITTLKNNTIVIWNY